jgi:hypothetical protein
MRGVITIRDVLLNLRLVHREFGPRTVWRCLASVLRGRKTTFLEVAFREDPT